MFLDGILVVVALKIAQIIRPSLSSWADWIREFTSPPDIELYFYLLFAAVWVIVFLMFSIYDPQKHLTFSEELTALLGGCLVTITILPGILFFTNRDISRVLFISFSLIASVLLISYRVIYRLAFRKGIIKIHKNKNILIVGAGIVGRRIGEQINNYSTLGFNIVGYVDDDLELIANQPDVLGDLEQAVMIIKERGIQHLVIALPRRAYDRITYVVTQVQKLPVRVWVIPDYFALALNQAALVEFAGFPMINLRAPALTSYQKLIKRSFDLLIAIPLFALTLPLLSLITLLIKLDSEGPVLYKSNRIKENGETFEMLKFRTMVCGADKLLENVVQYDEKGHVIHKRPNDPRVTKIGKFLRKTSLDELPQLINIIRGDMSLVGPRPELPEMVDLYEPWQRARFAVPQGLTGWWQVNGRSDKPMHLHTDEDLYYIQHYSIWLDIKILLRTVRVVIKGKGAY